MSEPHPPYPDPARYARLMAERDGFAFEDLDQGRGYLFRLSKAGRSFVSAAGAVCAYPINSATAHGLARDKAHSKTLLQAAGVPCAPGRVFFLGGRFAALQPADQGPDQAVAYAAGLGFPVFCKPNSGSRGDFAEPVSDAVALQRYLSAVAERYDMVLIEPLITAPECRVLSQDGRALCLVEKAEAVLTGDGQSPIGSLAQAMNDRLALVGLSAVPEAVLAGLDQDQVLGVGDQVALAGRRNLSAGAEPGAVSLSVPPSLAEIAAKALEALGLRLGAVDLFLTAEGPLVIEVNSNPAVTALERAGHLDVILDLWRDMAEDLLATHGGR